LLYLLLVLLPLLELFLSLLPLLLLPHIFVVVGAGEIVGMIDIILLGRFPIFGIFLLELVPHVLIVGAGDTLGKIVFLLDRLLCLGNLYLGILWGPSDPLPLPLELAFGDPLPRTSMLSTTSDSLSFLSLSNEKKSSMLSMSRGRLSFSSTFNPPLLISSLFVNWTAAESSALPTICRML